MFKFGIFDKFNNNTIEKNVTSAEHNFIARNLSLHSTVLLKNQNNILPLNDKKIKKIAVIGKAANEHPIISGGGFILQDSIIINWNKQFLY